MVEGVLIALAIGASIFFWWNWVTASFPSSVPMLVIWVLFGATVVGENLGWTGRPAGSWGRRVWFVGALLLVVITFYLADLVRSYR